MVKREVEPGVFQSVEAGFCQRAVDIDLLWSEGVVLMLSWQCQSCKVKECGVAEAQR